MPVTIPSTYSPYITEASQETGIPVSVIAAQAQAQGWAQFNPSSYIAYMNPILQMEGGSVFKALEAYSAGSSNLAAGSAYANSVMQAAGEPSSLTATPNATLDSFNPFGLIPGLGQVGSGITGAVTNSIFGDLGNSILGWLGVPDLKDLLQRLGLILFGAVLIIVGLVMLTKEPAIKMSTDAIKTVAKSPVK
jgi:hypothetical protein